MSSNLSLGCIVTQNNYYNIKKRIINEYFSKTLNYLDKIKVYSHKKKVGSVMFMHFIVHADVGIHFRVNYISHSILLHLIKLFY